MANDNIIKIKNVSFSYPESDTPAIDNISFNVRRGSWTSIIGHNGSGKSTIIRLINGLLVPDESGDPLIEVDGIKLTDDTVWEVRNRVGIVFQNPDNQFVGATVADDVAFGLENRGIPHSEMVKIVPEAIKAVGMSEYANSEPANLSGGQKQRVAIAGILAIKPKIIVLDEATSMLDPEGRNQILSIVQDMKDKYDLTVISITHDIDEANMADQVLVMNDGKLKDLRRHVSLVFQFPETQLFENIVLDDIAFGPKNFGYDSEKALESAKYWLKKVGLSEEIGKRSPFELSGGQMRRVAIAGVMAYEPDILCLDEPAAGLDPEARKQMMALFSDYQKEGHTVILVTHNMDDVAKYADNVLVMEQGKLIKQDTPTEIFKNRKWLQEHHLEEPKASLFAAKLTNYKFTKMPLNINSLVKEIEDNLKG